MKMTRLEWTYLQRIALDHPYFDTHKLPLTEQEAKAIVEANIKMTGKEFVDSIYAKLGMIRPAEEKKRFAKLRSIGELFTVPPIRKIAIVVLVVVLMTVFFSATPTGRAIAESVIHYFATLFDDGIVSINRSDNEAAIISIDVEPNFKEDEILEQENGIIYVNTFEEFTMAMGVQPVVLPYPHAKIYYYYDESVDYLKLNVIYETPKGKIITYQIWNTEAMLSYTSTGFTNYDPDPLFYYSVEENGTITVMRLYVDSIMEVVTEYSYTVDDIIGLLIDK